MQNENKQSEDFDPRKSVIVLRTGQRRLVSLMQEHRMLAFLARRQYGKTTTFATIALLKMMQNRNHTVIFGSAKLNLSREIILKEASVLEKALSAARKITLADSESGKLLSGLNHDDFADLYEHSRLELRYYHDRGSYSRTKVVALRPDTVGETGDLMCDEIGRINNWREVWEAVEPIVASNPQFRLLLATTIPPDDSHYSFTQLAPTPGMEFAPNPEGNFYTSQYGVDVLRVDASDAFMDGIPLYDLKTGAPLSPEEHRAKADDKDAWDRNYGCKFLFGGSAAISLLSLVHAQTLGAQTKCQYEEDDLPENLEELFNPGPIVIGADPATTENATSNPFGLCFMQENNGVIECRLILSLKTADPKKPRRILEEVCTRMKGRVASVAIDASSERFWCAETADMLRRQGVITHLCVSGTSVSYLDEKMNLKNFLGMKACAALEDKRVALPAAQSIREDFRLVKKQKGGFDNDLSPSGRHGDLFDAFKLALYALENADAKAEATAVQVGQSRIQTNSQSENFWKK